MKQRHPTVPIIGFPRGAGQNYVAYAEQTGIDALALDTAVPLDWAMRVLPPDLPVQGKLDPIRLVAGGRALSDEVAAILAGCRSRPHIFNLGHGVVQQTPPEHVAALAEQIRSWQPA